jgi:hypothetical protein
MSGPERVVPGDETLFVQWTVRRSDGEDMFDEYGGMYSEDEAGAAELADQEAAAHARITWEDDSDDEPIDYVMERWQRVEVRTISVRPSEGRRRYYGEDEPA